MREMWRFHFSRELFFDCRYFAFGCLHRAVHVSFGVFTETDPGVRHGRLDCHSRYIGNENRWLYRFCAVRTFLCDFVPVPVISH